MGKIRDKIIFDYTPLISSLKSFGVRFSPGLSPAILDKIERFYFFKFPKSLRDFYSQCLPRGAKYPKWNDFSNTNAFKIISMLNSPFDGLYFNVKNRGYWPESWGEKPSMPHAVRISCLEKVGNAPKLIPICRDCYMPVLSDTDNPPVLSVRQTEIDYCGADLADYFMKGHNLYVESSLKNKKLVSVPFWIEQ